MYHQSTGLYGTGKAQLPVYLGGVRDTSKAALTAIKPKVPTMHTRILAFRRAGEDNGANRLVTRAEIAQGLNIPTATVSARCNELIKLGKIKVLPAIECTITGRKVQLLSLRP